MIVRRCIPGGTGGHAGALLVRKLEQRAAGLAAALLLQDRLLLILDAPRKLLEPRQKTSVVERSRVPAITAVLTVSMTVARVAPRHTRCRASKAGAADARAFERVCGVAGVCPPALEVPLVHIECQLRKHA